MRIYIYFYLIFIIGCTYDTIPADFCKGCTSSFKLNGIDWASKPFACNFTQNRQDNDTSFSVTILEKSPVNDLYSDVLNLSKIPYRPGKYVLDSIQLSAQDGIGASFFVYEYEYDTNEQEYYPDPDSLNFIEVEFLDKSTRAFKLSFSFTLSIPGGENGTLHQSTYPKILHIENGIAEGYILSE